MTVTARRAMLHTSKGMGLEFLEGSPHCCSVHNCSSIPPHEQPASRRFFLHYLATEGPSLIPLFSLPVECPHPLRAGTRVGRVAGPFLLDRRDGRLAFQRREAGRTLYQDAYGGALAETEARDEGVRLTFLPDGQGSPFVKMLLLAATLVHNEQV